jgi:hypothetical protein
LGLGGHSIACPSWIVVEKRSDAGMSESMSE